MTFTHLHVRTAFSAHYGVARPEALVAAAAADGADALGCTDRDGLYGAVKHLGACRAAGIDPILGVDLRVGDPDRERFHRVVVLAAGDEPVLGGGGPTLMMRSVIAGDGPWQGQLVDVEERASQLLGLADDQDIDRLLSAVELPGLRAAVDALTMET